MNSLVVFLSVVALAVAKPSGLAYDGGLLAYSSPIIAAAPAAFSHQSRLDIKSSPAVVATTAIEPIARSVVAAPAVLAAPAIATAAIAPAAISSQSRIDIKTTPAITSTVVSAPVAYSAPALAYSAPALAYSAPALAYSAPALAYKSAAVAYNTPISYSAPLDWAWTGSAGAVGLEGWKTGLIAPSLPLDTPEVIAARAAHFEAKALAGAHLIKKRSASLIASPLLSTPLATSYAAGPLISSYPLSYSAPLSYHTPLSYSAPLGLSTPLLTKAYGVHPW